MLRGRVPARREWLTWPNLVTLVRLALVVPIVLLLVRGDDPGLTLGLLVVFGVSDWVDGFLARRLGQVSSVGKLLDPVADRVGVAAIVLGFILAGELALWIGIVIAAMDAAVALCVAVSGLERAPRVSMIGKVRTGVLMTGLACLGVGLLPGYAAFAVAGQIITAIGAALHIVAGAGYVRAAILAQRAERRSAGRASEPVEPRINGRAQDE